MLTHLSRISQIWHFSSCPIFAGKVLPSGARESATAPQKWFLPTQFFRRVQLILQIYVRNLLPHICVYLRNHLSFLLCRNLRICTEAKKGSG